MTTRSVEGWPRWLAALLMGLLLILALLIASWLLRTCAPVESLGKVVVLEAEPLEPPPPAPIDPTPALKASFDNAAADGRKLAAELAALEADIKRRLAQCKPVALAVLTVECLSQAKSRSGGNKGDAGAFAMNAALRTHVELCRLRPMSKGTSAAVSVVEKKS